MENEIEQNLEGKPWVMVLLQEGVWKTPLPTLSMVLLPEGDCFLTEPRALGVRPAQWWGRTEAVLTLTALDHPSKPSLPVTDSGQP